MHIRFTGCLMIGIILPVFLTAQTFESYPTYGEMNQTIDGLLQRCPDIVEKFALEPKTIEGRDIWAVKISNSPGVDNKKPQSLVIGVQHAEEPIGAAVIEYDMNYLCDNYATDPEIKWLVDNRQMYFVPISNPDGYVYLEPEGGPGWRQNRRVNGDGSIGVDLNRNFPYKWGYDDRNSSPTPGSFTYRGTEPASEPETRAMMNLVNSNKFRTWQNHHSANDVLEYPWDYDYTVPLSEQHLNSYLAICEEQLALYRYTECGPSYVVYNGWAPNGGTVDWGHSDSATYQIYTMITELGERLWESPAAVQSIVEEMEPADRYMAEAAGFYPVLDDFTLTDNCAWCTDDGILNPGEFVTLSVSLRNKSVVDTTLNVQSTLRSSQPVVHVSESVSTHGSVLYLEHFNNQTSPFSFYVSQGVAQGTEIKLDVVLTWQLNSVAYEKSLPITFIAGPDTLSNVGMEPGSFKSNPLVITGVTSSLNSLVAFKLNRLYHSGEFKSISLDIYNTKGLVASVHPTSISNQIIWNKRNHRGNPADPGVYFARLGRSGVNQIFSFSLMD